MTRVMPASCPRSDLRSRASHPSRPAMTNYVQAFIGKLVSHFPWTRPAAARKEAIRMTASMVGALVLARSVDDPALSREILKAVMGQFSESFPNGGKPPRVVA